MKINKYKYTGLVLMSALFMTSCSDVVDIPSQDLYTSNGVPVINKIYDVQDTGYVKALSSGVLNQMLRIEGTNLSHVTSITFNGLEVDNRTGVYAQSDVSWVTIPRKIPESITDTLVYTTEQGTYKMYFPVTIPNMELNGLHNEFAIQGDKVKVNGDYFDLFDFNDTTETSTSTMFIHNDGLGYSKQLKTDSITESYMGLKIPKDAPDNSIITFTWYEMGTKYTKNIPYRMTDQLMFGNFDGDLGWWNDWGKGLVTNGSNSGDPESLGYGFLRITGSYDSWSWNSTGFGTNWRWLDASAHPENYVCKFEVSTASSYPFIDYGENGKNGTKNGGYCLTLNNGSVRNQFDPVSDGLTNTYGEWATVSVPLVDMLGGSTLPTAESSSLWVAMELVLQPNTSETWKVDHSFGQFRIEPKNY